MGAYGIYSNDARALKEKEKFVDAVYKDIQAGYLNDVEIDLEVHGGKKGAQRLLRLELFTISLENK